MARPKGAGTDARERLIAAAGRGFKKGGYGGIGVDALAKEAGLTSGAFYAHLGSKAAAFRVAVDDGMAFLMEGITLFQEKYGEDWRDKFVDFYLGERIAIGLDESCALPTLTSDVARSDDDTRGSYEAALKAIARKIAEGPGRPISPDDAWAFLSILAGAASMARAVQDARLRDQLLNAAARVAKSM